MSQLILLSSSHPLFLIDQYRPVSEIYLHNANIRSKLTLILKILPEIPNNFKQLILTISPTIKSILL